MTSPGSHFSDLQVMERLCYHQLRDDGIIPDIYPVSLKGEKDNFPPILTRFIDKSHRSEAFQYFYERYLWSMQTQAQDPLVSGEKSSIPVYNSGDYDASWEELLPVWKKVSDKYKGKKTITEDMWDTLGRSKRLKPWYDSHRGVYDDLTAREEYILLSQSLDLEMGPDMTLTVTPYALGVKTVYGVFVTSDVRSPDTERALLKLVLDFTAYRLAGDSFTQVGLILPLQGRVVIRDLSDWKSEAFFSVIQHGALNPIVSVFRDLSFEEAEELTRINNRMIGRTVPRANGYETISKQCNSSRKPFQMCITVLQSDSDADIGYKDKKPIKKKDYPLIYKSLQKHKTRMFILAPRQTRLSEENHWSHNIAKENLLVGDEIGASGLLLYAGSGTQKSEAEDLMYQTLTKLIEVASEECPILLQTPAKEDNELITNVEAFGSFYNRFTSEEKKKIKISVDTCRVFSAGYQPDVYIARLEEIAPKSVLLVQFNGSRVHLGACVCRHSWDWTQQAIYTSEIARDKQNGHNGVLGIPETTNKLPLSSLLNVARWCQKNEIAMVTEK